MKSYIIAATILSTITLNCYAIGGVVSDPGAYARMAQQIEQQTKQILALKDNIEATVRAAKNLEGNLKRGAGIDSAIRDFAESLEQSIPTFIIPTSDDPRGEKQMENIKKAIEQVYNADVSIEDYEQQKSKKENYRQRAAKSALLTAEKTIVDIQKSMEKMAGLSTQIDQTQNQKDATDMGNRINHEMLLNQTKMTVLLGELVRLQGADGLDGVNDDDFGENNRKSTYEQYKEMEKEGNKYFKSRPEAKNKLNELMGK